MSVYLLSTVNMEGAIYVAAMHIIDRMKALKDIWCKIILNSCHCVHFAKMLQKQNKVEGTSAKLHIRS